MAQPNNKIAQASVKDHVALTVADLANINNPSNGSMAIVLDTCNTYVYKDGWEIYVSSGGADGNDYVDSISLEAGNILTLGRTGALADLTVDLTSLVDDTNLARIVSGDLVGGTLTLTRDDASTFNIDLSALVNQTDAEIKTQYEANADTNAFTDAEQTKLGGIETLATADQTGAEIKIAYEGEADTNAYTDAEKTKLNGIEALAEVNVNPDWNAVSGDAEILNKPDLSLKADLVAGKVPASQLPSYVDDVLEAANLAALPVTGETSKLYVTLDDNKIFRWTGTIYVEVSADAGAPVSSVNTQTGAVVLDADDIDDAATAHKFATAAEITAIGTNSAKVSADGSVTTHSDITDAGSGAIITSAERTVIGKAGTIVVVGSQAFLEFVNPPGLAVGSYKVEITL